MSGSSMIACHQDMSLDGLASLWASVPTSAQCLLTTIDEAKLAPVKPANCKLDTLWEARCFWSQHEVYWRKVQRRSHAGLVHAFQVVVSGDPASFSEDLDWQAVTRGNKGQFFISRYFQVSSRYASLGRDEDGTSLITVPFVPLQTEAGAVYQQWQPLDLKEQAHEQQ